MFYVTIECRTTLDYNVSLLKVVVCNRHTHSHTGTLFLDRETFSHAFHAEKYTVRKNNKNNSARKKRNNRPKYTYVE
jgi:hypothetical protein